MPGVIINLEKTERNRKRTVKTFILTDLDAEKFFGDKTHIEAKLRLAFQRNASYEGTESHLYSRTS
jgi:hypothetical protein